MPKDSNITEVVELLFTACWDLQGDNSRQARSRHAEPRGVQSMCASVCGRHERVENSTGRSVISVMAISVQESPPWSYSWRSCDNVTFLIEKVLLFQLKCFISSRWFNKLPIWKAFLMGEKLKHVSTS